MDSYVGSSVPQKPIDLWYLGLQRTVWLSVPSPPWMQVSELLIATHLCSAPHHLSDYGLVSEWRSQLYLDSALKHQAHFCSRNCYCLALASAAWTLPRNLKWGLKAHPGQTEFTAHPKQTAWQGVTQGRQSLSKADLGIEIMSSDWTACSFTCGQKAGLDPFAWTIPWENWPRILTHLPRIHTTFYLSTQEDLGYARWMMFPRRKGRKTDIAPKAEGQFFMGRNVAKTRFPAETCWASSREGKPWRWSKPKQTIQPSYTVEGTEGKETMQRIDSWWWRASNKNGKGARVSGWKVDGEVTGGGHPTKCPPMQGVYAWTHVWRNRCKLPVPDFSLSSSSRMARSVLLCVVLVREGHYKEGRRIWMI